MPERRRGSLTASRRDLVAPGTRFHIANAPSQEGELELLVVSSRSVWTTGSLTPGVAPSIRHDLVCTPSARPFRPKRIEKRRIAGVQAGLVVGQEGKEIDVDEEGRVEVEFRWDRRDLHGPGASRRVRVSQGWAGVGYGLVTLPRVSDAAIARGHVLDSWLTIRKITPVT